MRVDDEIYLTILYLLEEKGPMFTTAELAVKLKISKRTLYKMFASKEMIIEKVIDYIFKDLYFDSQQLIGKTYFHSGELLQKYLGDFTGVLQVEKVTKHARVLEKRYPQQWIKLNAYLNELGKRLYDLFIIDPHVRILTTAEKEVLLVMIQQTTRKFLQDNYLATKGLNFKEAIKVLYKMILTGIAC
ncbi:TetR/AcrR family transcriptional regulator [Liquorilactobacillus capillatus]|uniref:HTH tetR-type domain-containing protein n=1 Tax=Liquorilactobacillus capillatus DSM 19910 TaxID=1423731 RepID=A0A0R1LXZ9_9LACO|nr:TetR/AcrR family transcriptional regulator [Liquorilactobacillus capillatus]KRL00566.1 hypothetical protein FC81_GL001922 [Liquorilactobacillus capillatus DSM 19910]